MYQTVGHEAVEWIGRALELPLYRRKIVGKSEESGRTYVYNSNDEVEDLAELLREAQVSCINRDIDNIVLSVPGGLVVRIWRSHRHGRGSIPRLGVSFFSIFSFLFLFYV